METDVRQFEEREDREEKVGIRRLLLLLALLLVGVAGFLYLSPPEPLRQFLATFTEPPGHLVESRAQDAGMEKAKDAGSADVAPTRPEVLDKVSVLELVAHSSESEILKGWTEESGFLRRVTAAVLRIAEGRSPRPVLGFVQIPGRFSVVEKQGRSEGETRFFVSRHSHDRYEKVAKLVGTLDAAEWGRNYQKARPVLERVFAEVASPGERFDHVLQIAILKLVDVEIPSGQPELTEKGAIFLFRDPRLEALSDAEKHLVRMGRKNGRIIQTALRTFSESAGLGGRERDARHESSPNGSVQ